MWVPLRTVFRGVFSVLLTALSLHPILRFIGKDESRFLSFLQWERGRWVEKEGGVAFVSYQGVTPDFSIRSLVHLLRKPQIAEPNSGGSQKSENSVFSVYCFLLNRVGRKFRQKSRNRALKIGYRTWLVWLCW